MPQLKSQYKLQDFTFYKGIANDILHDDNLEYRLKVLLGAIASLSRKDGYCYGGNEYLAQCVANKYKKVSARTIGRWVKELEDLGIIFREPGEGKFQRYIKIRQSYVDYLQELKTTPTRVKRPVKVEEVKEEIKETAPVKVSENTNKNVIPLTKYTSDPVKTFLNSIEADKLKYYNAIKKWLDHKLANGHTFSNVKNVEYEFMRLLSIVKNDNIDADFLVDYNIKHGYLKLFKPEKLNKSDMTNDELITDNEAMEISENDEFIDEIVEKFFNKPIHSREEFEDILMTLPTISDEEADRLIAERKQKHNPPPEPIVNRDEDITNYGPRNEEIIDKFKNLIYKNFGNYVYEGWFSDLIIRNEENNIILESPNQFILDTIQKEYAKEVTYPGGHIKMGLQSLAKKAVAMVNKMFRLNRRIDDDEIGRDEINNANVNLVFRLRKPKA